MRSFGFRKATDIPPTRTAPRAAARSRAQELRTEPRVPDRLRRDDTLWRTPNGAYLYAERADLAGAVDGSRLADAKPERTSLTARQVLNLHSRRTTPRKIFLNVQGWTLADDSVWNRTGLPQAVPPLDLDGRRGLSRAEIDYIAALQRAVAEDFAAFDVDVTTARPTRAQLERAGRGDSTYGVMALVTNRDVIDCGCSGVSFLDTFSEVEEGQVDKDRRVFWSFRSGSSHLQLARIITHEAGHTLGLIHDSAAVRLPNGEWDWREYAGDTPLWAPIMGLMNNAVVAQWDTGEFPGAANSESDIDVIAQHLRPRRDDHGDTVRTATPTGTRRHHRGIIGVAGDKDVFAHRVTDGTLRVNVHPMGPDPDLNLSLQVRDARGRVVAAAAPVSHLLANQPGQVVGLGAWITRRQLPNGTYYLIIDGAGESRKERDGSVSRYSDYGSIGTYTLSVGSAPAPHHGGR